MTLGSINPRRYGEPPFSVVLVHGGPGAPGVMAPVGRCLGKHFGVVEPFQTACSMQGQIAELEEQIRDSCYPPVVLVGSSWGCILSLFVAARAPDLVKKVILVGSAVFDATNAAKIETTRLKRMPVLKRRRYDQIQEELKRASGQKRNRLFSQWGELLFDCDVVDPITRDLEVLEVQANVFACVWPEFVALRDRPGSLRDTFSQIGVPTVVIHGDWDPHPIEGIRPFLERCLKDVSFHVLTQCGHYPWVERRARKRFFEILKKELG